MSRRPYATRHLGRPVTTARYLLCPGPVHSRVDGQVHHVGAAELMRLYGAKPAECVVMPSGPGGLLDWALGCLERGELIALHPRFDGEYRLPEPAPGGSRQPTTP